MKINAKRCTGLILAWFALCAVGISIPRAQTMEITNPSGGRFAIGSPLTIEWSWNPGSEVTITMSKNKGKTFPITITMRATTSTSGIGSYVWIIPDSASYLSDSAKVRINDYNSAQYRTTSSLFIIFDPTPIAYGVMPRPGSSAGFAKSPRAIFSLNGRILVIAPRSGSNWKLQRSELPSGIFIAEPFEDRQPAMFFENDAFNEPKTVIRGN